MHYLSTNKTLIKKQSVKKWLSSKCCHFVKKYFYGIKLLHAKVQCVYIVYTKYQDVSVNAVEQVDFPVYALPMHYLSKSKTSKQEKMAKFTKLLFCQKLIFWHKPSSCKCSMCLYYVGKVSDSFSKSSGTS